jgi:hypothetical protein
MTNGAQAMSGLASYVRGVLGIADELRGSLTAEDIERLHTHFKGTKLQPWLRWRIEHEGLVLAFVAATPAERKKLKKYEEHRLLLTVRRRGGCNTRHHQPSAYAGRHLPQHGSCSRRKLWQDHG